MSRRGKTDRAARYCAPSFVAARFGGPFDLASDTANADRNARYAAALRSAMPPDAVAGLVLDAIRAGRRYVFTDPQRRDEVARRFAAILADFDAISGGSA